jgi:hypothetical protein
VRSSSLLVSKPWLPRSGNRQHGQGPSPEPITCNLETTTLRKTALLKNGVENYTDVNHSVENDVDNDSAENDGGENDSAENDGAENDGAENDGVLVLIRLGQARFQRTVERVELDAAAEVVELVVTGTAARVRVSLEREPAARSDINL